jgi:HlyD family secretion protein
VFFAAGDGTTTLVGTVMANEAIVAPKVTGRIARLLVQEGDTVKAGGVVATLGPDELDAERRDHVARIAQLEARLRQTQEVVTLEGDRVTGRLAMLRADAEAAAAEHAAAEAELVQRRGEAARARALLQAGLLARQEGEQLDTELRTAEARVRIAEERVRSAQAEIQLSESGARQVAVATEDQEQARAQRAQAQAQFAQIEARLSDLELRAPLNGVVGLRVAREGEVVRAGEPVVTVVDLDDIWVRAQVEEGLIGRLHVGQVLNVRLASGGEVEGRVTFIAPEAEFATQRDVSRVKRDVRTFAFKVAIPNAERRIHPGMTAYVLFPPPASGQ